MRKINGVLPEGRDMKGLSLLFGILVLAGCATEAKYTQSLQSWIGMDELSLIRAWGPPGAAYMAGGHKFLEYSRSGSMFLPGVAPTYQTNVYGNTAYTNSYGGSPAMNIQLSCITTFEIDGNTIVGGTWRGNNCVAK